MTNFRQMYAIQNKNKQKFLKLNNKLNDDSGIYFLIREDENGFKYAYVGQAKHILTRLAQHMTGYQHIDLSLKKHGLYSDDNIYGWKVNAINYPISKLDEMEQHYIKQYALNGYQLRNKTSGSQGKGKAQIDDYKPHKTYRQGIEQGKKNCSKEISHLFDLHLRVVTKNEVPTINQQKALDKFNSFLEYHKGNNENG